MKRRHSTSNRGLPPVSRASSPSSVIEEDAIGIEESAPQTSPNDMTVVPDWEDCVSNLPLSENAARFQVRTPAPYTALPETCSIPGELEFHAEAVLPVRVSPNTFYPSDTGSGTDAASHDMPNSAPASLDKAIDCLVDQSHDLSLDAASSTPELTAHGSLLPFQDQQLAEDPGMNFVAAAAGFYQECIDLDEPEATRTSWQQNIWVDADTENHLTTHYFDTICGIISCFDSRQNPFRKDIPRLMLNCEYITDCVHGLTAAHLANSTSGMKSIALKHQTRAMRGLMSVLKNLQLPNHGRDNDRGLSRVSAKYARHQALLAALLLGISAVSTAPRGSRGCKINNSQGMVRCFCNRLGPPPWSKTAVSRVAHR